mmetsp:Transcript_13469/g.24934  ORF Transcript_13469/g.24934 Transcript_13469/m.24934 type:complete len:242 (+) Transcript_13469:266-991(+)
MGELLQRGKLKRRLDMSVQKSEGLNRAERTSHGSKVVVRQNGVRESAAHRLPKSVVLSIIAMANDLKMHDLLLKNGQDENRKLVKKYSSDLRFMLIALQHDRALLRFATPQVRQHERVVTACLNRIYSLLDDMRWDPLDALKWLQARNTWHRPAYDTIYRERFIQGLVDHLCLSQLTAEDAWFKAFKFAIPKLELKLYLSSTSLEEYMNPDTIFDRLYKSFSPEHQKRINQLEQPRIPQLL